MSKSMTAAASLLAASALALALASCGGNPAAEVAEPTLKEAFGDKFLIGVAASARQVAGEDTAALRLIKTHFNAIVAEDCMKCETIHPEEGRYDFVDADSLVAFGERNGMAVTGHCLIWHSQCAPWFFVDGEGRQVSPEELRHRMKDHISTIVGRYKGRILGWDVVNEAIEGDGSYRRSKFYEILGEEYIPLAFEYAHEADPDAELYYNDYGMDSPAKRRAVVRLIKSLQERGLRIDAVGMQGHMGIDYPDIGEFRRSMDAFAACGVRLMVTEWEMSALPTISTGANISDTVAFRKEVDPYRGGLPDSVSSLWNSRMKAFFSLFLSRADVVERVTAWGVSDGDSWKNDYPMKGRTDYPLLFDRDHRMKPFLRELAAPKTAKFSAFTYSAGKEGDATASEAIQNPILRGCYPDPSICRVGEDYYIVNSSFAFFPGIPIWHSTDLKAWERLGYVLDRPSQLDLGAGRRISGGIYAPDIKYNPHDGKFYVISTDVEGAGTFFVTTDDPKAGRWSDPTPLPDVGGIDPSFLFDDDGKAYIVNNDAPKGVAEYDGHRAIWIREFDYKAGRTVGRRRVIIDAGVNKAEKPIWIEGPHLYHIDGRYFLMAAEGGTSTQHREVIFSAESPFGPFTPCRTNPILTQKDLPADRPNPVTCAGHADLVQTPEGDWFAVFLAVRPYADGHDVMGRETFLLPVSWEDGQPVILPQGGVISYCGVKVPPTPLWTASGLAADALFIRTPRMGRHSIGGDGSLVLEAGSEGLGDWRQPSAMGRWVTDMDFRAQTSVAFTPQSQGDFAGLMLFHDDGSYAAFGKTSDGRGGECLTLEVRSLGNVLQTTSVPVKAGREAFLRVEGDGLGNYVFSHSDNPGKGWTAVGEPVPADLFSTKTAGGFTGTVVGIFAQGDYNYKD